jgi:hypothetical protein
MHTERKHFVATCSLNLNLSLITIIYKPIQLKTCYAIYIPTSAFSKQMHAVLHFKISEIFMAYQ